MEYSNKVRGLSLQRHSEIAQFKNEYEEHWGQIEYVQPVDTLRNCLESNMEILVATDGSNKNDIGTQAWLVANKNGDVLVRGRGGVQYPKEDASSLQPELAAILAVTTFLSWLWCRIYNLN